MTEMRREVFRRDGGQCVAAQIDEHAGPCYDRWGTHITKVPWDVGEIDYVRLESHGPRHTLAIDHVWLCPGHHRGTGPSAGYVYATSHRRELRTYLEGTR